MIGSAALEPATVESVTETARSPARDLDVGVLGVRPDETVGSVEPAGVTGAGVFEDPTVADHTHGLQVTANVLE